MTFSVFDLKIDNELEFGGGITAGHVLSINADGTTQWVAPQGGGGFTIINEVESRFAKISNDGADSLLVFNTPVLGSITTAINFVAQDVINTVSGFSSSIGRAIIGDVNDKIYVGGGFTSYNGTEANRIVRLNPDGTIDANFVTGFVEGSAASGFNNNVTDIRIDSNGKIYVVGNFTSYSGITQLVFGDNNPATNISPNRIIRLNPDGTIDANFVTGTGFNNSVNVIEIDKNSGKIYVAGNFTSYNGTVANRIIRLNPDGTVDTGFVYGTGLNFGSSRIYIQNDGKIYIGGGFTSYNGTVVNRIIRLNPDGSIDTAFDYGSGLNTTPNDIGIDINGKIYLVGSFTSYNGTSANRIVRLNPDGSIDTAFDYGSGLNQVGWRIYVVNDKTYIGGFFTQFNGVEVNYMMRLNVDGTIDNTFVSKINEQVSGIYQDSNGDLYIGGFFSKHN